MPLYQYAAMDATGRERKGQKEAANEEAVTAFLKEQGIAPEECAVIGDTLHDRDMAKAIGCPVCLLDRGHQRRKELEASGEPVFHRLEDIGDFLLSGI